MGDLLDRSVFLEKSLISVKYGLAKALCSWFSTAFLQTALPSEWEVREMLFYAEDYWGRLVCQYVLAWGRTQTMLDGWPGCRFSSTPESFVWIRSRMPGVENDFYHMDLCPIIILLPVPDKERACVNSSANWESEKDGYAIAWLYHQTFRSKNGRGRSSYLWTNDHEKSWDVKYRHEITVQMLFDRLVEKIWGHQKVFSEWCDVATCNIGASISMIG